VIEEFSHPVSVIAHIDPRVKIVLVFIFSVMVAVSDKFLVLLSALAVDLCIVLIASISAKEIIRRLIPVNMLVLLLWLFLPFTFAGEPLFFVGKLPVTREGIFYAARISLKSNTIMLMLIVLVGSTSIFTLGHAMNELGIPKKMVHLFFFTYRYIHVIHREYLRLVNAIKIRGFSPRTNLHTYKTFAYMVGMILVKSADRAQRVHNAMLCRGFKGNLYSLSEFSLKKNDIISLVVMAVVVVLLGVFEWTQMT